MVRLAAEKRVELWKKFESLDKSGDGKLDFKEMKALLQKSNPNLQDEALKVLFKRIDTNDDGSVDFDEFVDYLYKSPPVYHKAPEICVQKFREFAGKDMDGNEFRNFCLMCNLVDKKFTRGDIDTLFAKVCPRGKRRITLEIAADGFSQYDKLLSLLAEKKKVPIDTIFELVSGGERVVSGTIPQTSRLHDDERCWTETRVHARPESYFGDSIGLTDTSRSTGRSSPRATRQRHPSDSSQALPGESDWADCQTAFDAYDQDGEGLLSYEFAKLCEDVGIAQSIFTEGRTVGTIYRELNKDMLDFNAFKDALRLISTWTKEPIGDLQATFGSCIGP